LAVPGGVAAGGRLPDFGNAAKLRTRFFAVHDQYYGFHSDTDPVELINVRLTASAALTCIALPKVERTSSARPKLTDHRHVWFARAKPLNVPVYDRAELRPGQSIAGPAIVEQFDSTTVLYPGDKLRVDEAGNLHVKVPS
jgi:N-methylhydantoinase A